MFETLRASDARERKRITRLGAILALALGAATSAAAAPPYAPPRDAYGHPRLDGMWAARWLTNLERPVGTPLVLAPDAAAARAREILTQRGKADMFDGEIAEPDATTLAIVRGQYRGSLIVDPTDGRVPLSDAGRAALAAIAPPSADGPESRMPNERCIAGNSRPGMLIAPAVMLKQVVQTRDHVAIHSEAFSELRIIAPGAGRRDVGMNTWDGESTARWEGDALVVESTGFRASEHIRAVPFSRFPVRPQTRVVERFSRIGPNELLYEFQVEDPVLFTRPWRAEYAWTRTDERIYEFACHEGNYGLANILSGAREEERRAAAQAQPAGGVSK